MNQILFEIAVIFLLLVANGIFAMTEIAVVSARKSRLKRMADLGDPRAVCALALAEAPNRFLSTVQVGITLVGIVAGAFGGARLAGDLAGVMARWELVAPWAEALSFGIVVVAITYCSLIIGELVPKRVALGNPEGIALAMAGPMQKLSVLAGPVVHFLSFSTDGLLRLLNLKPTQESAVSEDEVTLLVREGMRAGVFLPAESAMVESVLALDRIPVRDLMTPRAKIIWINVADSHEAIWHKIVVSGHTTFPVYEGNRDQVVGVVTVKAIYANLAAGTAVNVKDLMTPALVVPAAMTATTLLEKFKQSGRHVALVADEFGGVTGLLSLHDIMEAIIGELPSVDERARPRAIRRDDGSWLIDGLLAADEFERKVTGFRLHPAAQRDYETFAGFVVRHLGHVPAEGETFLLHGYLVEVIDMDGHRVDKVLLIPSKPTGETPAPA